MIIIIIVILITLMDKEINQYLQENYSNLYRLDNEYIHNLFLEVRQYLKLIHYKNYNLKKQNIVKYIYQYFINYLNIDKKIIDISKRKQPEQRSEEWYNMRYNMVSASDAATVIDKLEYINETEFKKIVKHRPFKSKNDLIKTKILRNDEFKGNKYTQHGQIFEEVASLIYQKRTGVYIIEFGLIKHPNINIIGASPDGITQFGTMIEIKAPYSRVINGLIPSNYWIQMQLQLEVCNLEVCDFVEIKSHMYDSETEYINDTHPNDNLLTKEGLEKGIIIMVNNNNDSKKNYIYPHVDIYKDYEKLEKWKNDSLVQYKRQYDNVEICYWKISKYLCTTVNRDKTWFEKNLYKFYDFWKQIDFYKENSDELNKLINKKRKRTPSNVLIISDDDDDEKSANTLLISDDDDDDNNNKIKSNNLLNIESPKSENVNSFINVNDIVFDL